MSAGVSIEYGDFALGAKEAFVYASDDAAEFVDLTELNSYSLDVPNYGNPCEEFSVLLDGAAIPLTDDPDDEAMGFWSDRVADEDGEFTDDGADDPVVLTAEADSRFTCQGFTFTFETLNGIYPSAINIKWYRGATQLAAEDYSPDSAVFFAAHHADNAVTPVESFDKVVFTFGGMILRHNRLKIQAIDFGQGTVFGADELQNVSISQAVNPISTEIAINTADFTLCSKNDRVYQFQPRQPLLIRYNDNVILKTFIRSAERKAERVWSVKSEDYISILSETPFKGGIYDAKNVPTLYAEIFTAAGVSYNSTGDDGVPTLFSGETVRGWIPYTDCRTALMLLAFATRAVIDTSGGEIVRVYRLGETTDLHIGQDRVMRGQRVDNARTVTALELTKHAYKPAIDEVDAFKADGVAAPSSFPLSDLLVKFNEPLHTLEIVHGSKIAEGDNYAVITASDNQCVLTGEKYRHEHYIVREDNAVVLAADAENVVKIENATLVSEDNAAAVLSHIAPYIFGTDSVKAKIVDNKHVSGGDYVVYGNAEQGGAKYGAVKYGDKTPVVVTYDTPVEVGQLVSIATPYLGNKVGRVTKLTYNLNGGIVVKDAVIECSQ